MNLHKIDVDEEVWQYLKKNGEPFEDTPNSVLKRLLFGNKIDDRQGQIKIQASSDFPIFPHGTPKALAQTLEVVYGVYNLGLSRTRATKIVADKRRTDQQTIIDKYCRQLGKRAHEVDRLLEPENLSDFQSLLERKFTEHHGIIKDFFNSLKNGNHHLQSSSVPDSSADPSGKKSLKRNGENLAETFINQLVKSGLTIGNISKHGDFITSFRVGQTKFYTKYANISNDRHFLGFSLEDIQQKSFSFAVLIIGNNNIEKIYCIPFSVFAEFIRRGKPVYDPTTNYEQYKASIFPDRDYILKVENYSEGEFVMEDFLVPDPSTYFKKFTK